jgi:hypothetical protein
MESPLTPSLSPLTKGGEGRGEGGFFYAKKGWGEGGFNLKPSGHLQQLDQLWPQSAPAGFRRYL